MSEIRLEELSGELVQVDEVIRITAVDRVHAVTRKEMEQIKAELIERRAERDEHAARIRELVAEEEVLAQVLGVFERKLRKDHDDEA